MISVLLPSTSSFECGAPCDGVVDPSAPSCQRRFSQAGESFRVVTELVCAPSVRAPCINRKLTTVKATANPMPSLKSDADAEQFVAAADLSQFDLSGFKPIRFEFEPKAAALNMHLLQNLLDAVRLRAKVKGIPYTRYVRRLLESDVAG